MKRALKWLGYLVGGIVVLLLIAVGTVYAVSSSRMSRSYATNVPVVPIPADSAAIARGKHLAVTVGKCPVCHGDNYSGKLVMDDPVFLQLTSANLTAGKGGVGNTYTDEDWVRSIRYGIARDGKSLIFMPAEAFTNFSDTDLGQIIAYLRTLPPADMAVAPQKSVGPIGRAVYLTGGFPLLPASLVNRDMPRPEVTEADTPEYGHYLVNSGGCTGCHGPNLGGSSMGSTKTPNLTPRGELGKWTQADFVKAIRTGIHPSGRILSAEMPWPYMKGLTDLELSAMWKYLQTVAPVEVAAK
jgi:mono/diheme cytochrome c family protein